MTDILNQIISTSSVTGSSTNSTSNIINSSTISRRPRGKVIITVPLNLVSDDFTGNTSIIIDNNQLTSDPLRYNQDFSFRQQQVNTYLSNIDLKHLITSSSTVNGVDSRDVNRDRIIEGLRQQLLQTNLGATSQERQSSANNLDLEENNSPPKVEGFQFNVYRLANEFRQGTYLFAGYQEARNTTLDSSFGFYPQNNPSGNLAFQAIPAGLSLDEDSLTTIHRYQNRMIPSTYLYVNQGEHEIIKAQQTIGGLGDFLYEGEAFQVFEPDANKGVDFYRFQNLQVQGTYIFVTEAEKNSIINDPNLSNIFQLEGVAFEAII